MQDLSFTRYKDGHAIRLGRKVVAFISRLAEDGGWAFTLMPPRAASSFHAGFPSLDAARAAATGLLA